MLLHWYEMMFLLTTVGLTPGGSSTVHIYTKQYIEQHNRKQIHRTTQLLHLLYIVVQITVRFSYILWYGALLSIISCQKTVIFIERWSSVIWVSSQNAWAEHLRSAALWPILYIVRQIAVRFSYILWYGALRLLSLANQCFSHNRWHIYHSAVGSAVYRWLITLHVPKQCWGRQCST